MDNPECRTERWGKHEMPQALGASVPNECGARAVDNSGGAAVAGRRPDTYLVQKPAREDHRNMTALLTDAAEDDAIRGLLASARTIAVVGASRNPARPVYGVMGAMQRAGYRCIPVNPGHDGHEILGERVFARLADIPERIDIVDVFRRQEALAHVVDEALALSPLPTAIWFQLGLRDDAAAAKARARGISVFQDLCIKVEHARLAIGTVARPSA